MAKTNLRKNVLNKLVDVLVRMAEDEEAVIIEEQPKEEPVQEDKVFILENGDKLFVKEDNTVYFENPEISPEPNFEYTLEDGRVFVTDEDGKFLEIREKEIEEEESPVEAPVNVDFEEESEKIDVKGVSYSIPVEVFNYIKELEEKLEKKDSEVTELKSQLPTITPIGVISKKEKNTQDTKRSWTDYYLNGK